MKLKKTDRKPLPLSDWAEHALKRIDEKFPSKRERKHPLVLCAKILVLAKDCGIDVWR